MYMAKRYHFVMDWDMLGSRTRRPVVLVTARLEQEILYRVGSLVSTLAGNHSSSPLSLVNLGWSSDRPLEEVGMHNLQWELESVGVGCCRENAVEVIASFAGGLVLPPAWPLG